jgi:Tol biopolymer transport system component
MNDKAHGRTFLEPGSLWVGALLLLASRLPAVESNNAAPAPALPRAPAAEVRGPYFGQKPPGKTPTLFAPGIISVPKFSVIRVTFSPDGNECYFTRSSLNGQTPWHLYSTRRQDNVWTPPEVVPLLQQGDFTGQPFFSPDGSTLYFTMVPGPLGHIYAASRTPQGWSNPQALQAPTNSSGSDVYYSCTLDGTVYFASDRPGGSGKLDIWRMRQVNGQPAQAENLGPAFNSDAYDYDPCVDPHGRYLLYAQDPNAAHATFGVYVTFSDSHGGWGTPVNMDTIILGFNTGGANGASLSPDGKFLFWSRYDDGQPHIYWVENPLDGLSAEKHAAATPAEPFARGPFFGQKPPGETPEPFAPGVLTSRYGFVARIAFSPNGSECFFTVTDAGFTRNWIMGTQCKDGIWSVPEVAPFTRGHLRSNEPFFSRDGNRVYFSSLDEIKPETNKRDLWTAVRTPEGWGPPRKLPPPVSSDFAEFFYSQAPDGTAYFTSNRPGGLGGFDLYSVRPVAGQPAQAENLGAPLNSAEDEWDPCIAPDGSYLVFASARPGGSSGTDLYVSFTDGHGGWTAPVNLGESFNGTRKDCAHYAPCLSPDGRYLFYTCHDGKIGELYWVQASVLERYRTTRQ